MFAILLWLTLLVVIMAADTTVTWDSNLKSYLQSLTTETADIILSVGDKQIMSHSFILDINSEILTVCESACSKDKRRQVVIDTEFAGSPNLVQRIVHSFYTGKLEVKECEVKVVYKFAILYNIQWMVVDMISRLNAMPIKPDNFYEMYRFSLSVGLKDLQSLCLASVDSRVVDALIESGDLAKMDGATVEKFTSLKLPEIKVFEVITKWYESNPGDRKGKMSALLSALKFHLIHKDDFDQVQNWIMAAEGLDDKMKIMLLIEINKLVKNPSLIQAPVIPQAEQAEVKIRQNNDIMEVITDFINKKGTSQQLRFKPLTSAEYVKVVRDLFDLSDPLAQQFIVEYLADNVGLINKASLTDFLILPQFEVNAALTGLIKAHSNYHENFWYLRWHDISNTTLDRVKVLSKSVDWNKLVYTDWLQGIEAIMEWGRVHDQSHIPDILQSVVCLCKVPDVYINMVLLPHLKVLLGEQDLELKCKIHPTRLSPHPVQTTALTNTFYLLQDSTVRLLHDYWDRSRKVWLRRDLTLNKASSSPLSVTSSHGYTIEKRFVLYDREQVMEQYPVYKHCTLSLIELRKLFVKYKQLSVMTFYSDQ